MAKFNALTDRGISSLVTKGERKFVADGNGLFLKVSGPGLAAWYFRIKSKGKVTQKSIGPLARHSLADARDIAKGMNEAIGKGLGPASALPGRFDPSAKKFADYATEFISGKKREHRNLKAHAQWQSTIDTYCGQIADKRPGDITYGDVLAVVNQPDLAAKRETRERVLQRVRVILDHAAKAEGEPQRFNPAVAVCLPKRKPEERVKHFAAAPYQDVPAIVASLRQKDSMSALVLRFSIATAARSGNVRNAEWSEIEGDVWNIPGHKMKTGEPFQQPLNAEALAVLELAKAKAPNSKRRIFPGPHGGLISDVAINKTLHAIYAGVTAHGFRSSFRDWGAETQTQFPAQAFELCLAHNVGTKVEQAYNRTKLFDIRKLILAAWNNYLNGRQNVVELVHPA